MKTIFIAGGCFWGVQAYYDKLKGIDKTFVGYANGNISNPTYQQVKSHEATHSETVKIIYDETIISLEKILEHFLRIIDPYEVNHQGEDYGIQYRTGVYYESEKDKEIIERYFNSIEKEKDFAIEVLRLANFYDAEEYHQKYLYKNPSGYCHVNFSLIKDNERK